MTAEDAGSTTRPASEGCLALAGAVVNGRYHATAVAAVRRDVVLYRADDTRTGRPIALEVLRDDLAADAQFVAAVREQAWKLASSAHMHRGVARVYDCGTTDSGGVFVALERTEGPTLREVLDARGALDAGTALRLAGQIGEALETLHHEDIVHGQLDANSVLVVTDAHRGERVTLIGVELTAAYRTPTGRRVHDAVPPAYLAPEQIERGESTEASDVYALGRLLRDMLTSEKVGSTASDAPADVAAVPAAIERIITTAVDPRPYHRYPDISVMLNDMFAAQATLAEAESERRPPVVARATNAPRRLRARPPRVARRIATVVVTAVVVAALVWGALSWRDITRARATAPTPSDRALSVSPTLAVPTGSGAPSTTDPAVSVSPATIPPAPMPSASGRPETSRLPSDSTDAAHAGLAREAAAAPAAPASLGREPAPPAVAPSRPHRRESTATAGALAGDVGDGAAAVDWLLKQRR